MDISQWKLSSCFKGNEIWVILVILVNFQLFLDKNISVSGAHKVMNKVDEMKTSLLAHRENVKLAGLNEQL